MTSSDPNPDSLPTPEFTEAEIEASRVRMNVPADWQWFMCANRCGEVVWVPPDAGDLPLSIVCSDACLMQLMFEGDLSKGPPANFDLESLLGVPTEVPEVPDLPLLEPVDPEDLEDERPEELR